MSLTTASFTAAGGHPRNEDAFLVQPHAADPSCWLCALADGQGGRSGGARAAQLACWTVIDQALRQAPHQLADGLTWSAILRQVDEVVRQDSQAGFTTLIGLAIVGNELAGASQGDSAAFVLAQGEPVRELTRAQHKNPPIGLGGVLPIPFGARLVSPWRVAAMSDGVWKYSGWQPLLEAIARLSGEELLHRLQERVRLRGSGEFPDDFTIVVLEDPG
jgi:hypothetical protein